MTALDVADLVVIAGQALGVGTDTALAQADIAAAQAALAEARPAGHEPGAAFRDRAAAAAAAIGLVHALLRHRPFPQHGEQVAVAAGLQLLSLNGWRAELDPPAAAAVVVEALASGRLNPDSAAAWLSPRLSPHPAPRVRRAGTQVPLPSLRPLRTLPATRIPARRALMSAMLAMAAGGVAVLATACSQGAAPSGTHTAGQPPAARHSPEPAAARASELAYAACMRAHGIEKFPGPSASTVIIIPATGVDVNSPQFRSAERTCQQVAPVPPAHIVIADEGLPG